MTGTSQFTGASVSKIVVDPSSPNIAYAAVNKPTGTPGIYETTNYGSTWKLVFGKNDAAAEYTDLTIDASSPAASRVLFAAIGTIGGDTNNGVYTSTDGGSTWTPAGNFPTGTSDGRIAIALAPSNDKILYAAIATPVTSGSTTSNLSELLQSIDGGKTWRAFSFINDFTGGQGANSLILAIDPKNSSTVYLGGSNDSNQSGLWETTNGGLGWQDIGSPGIDDVGPQPGHHAFAFGDNGKLLDGNDGGIFRLEASTTTGVDWTDLNANLDITQANGLALSPGNPNVAFIGSQDNGLETTDGQLNWNEIQGGTGEAVRIDQSNSSNVYAELSYPSGGTNFLQSSSDDGVTWGQATSGINTGDPGQANIPFVIDPSSDSRLVLGTNRIYESTDSGATWTAISTAGSGTWTTKAPIQSIGTVGSTIYAAAGGYVYITTNDGKTWTQTTPSGSTSNTYPSLWVDPSNPATAYLITGETSKSSGAGHVYMTTNSGTTWKDISGNLPNLPGHAVVINPMSSAIYVGLETGVYASTDGGAHWQTLATGLPNVEVADIEIDPTTGVIAVATHGRGVWESRVNQNPVGIPQTATIPQDTSLTFTTASFGYTDLKASPANKLKAVEISTLPIAGTISDAGTAITVGEFVAASDLSTGKLVYVPLSHQFGQDFDSFTFQVEDNGAAGSNLDLVPKSFTINVNYVDQAPQGTPNTITVNQDTLYTFQTADFGFTDPDNFPADAFQAVEITTLAGSGSLADNGKAVTAKQFVSVSDITAGKLIYTPVAHESGNGAGNFTFQVKDSGLTANGGTNLDPTPKSLTINVAYVDHAPVGTATTITINENSAYTFKTSDFGFSDPNNIPADAFQAVEITTLPAGGALTDSGKAITAKQFVPVSDITSGKLIYAPVSNKFGNDVGDFTFQVLDSGSTTNGGTNLDQTPRAFTINVNQVKGGPEGTSITTSINEDVAYTFKTADFGYSDPNDKPPATFTAVEITTLPANGSLTDLGKAVTAKQFVPVSDISAGKLVYTPVLHQFANDMGDFSFQVQDNASTTNGGTNLDPTPKSFTINVAYVDHAPQGTAITTSINEDATYTFKTADFGFSDPNNIPADAFQAVEITTLPASGSLTDSGKVVTAKQLVAVSDITAGSLVYRPIAHEFGNGAANFTFQVQDNGSTANGGTNLDPNAKSFTINVAYIDHAPQGSANTVSINENSTYTFKSADFGFSDPNNIPADAFQAVEFTTLPASGTLTDNGKAVATGQFVPVSDISAGNLIYAPKANGFGTNFDSFSFQVQDNGSLSAGGTNLDPNPKTFTFNVSEVVPPPALNGIETNSTLYPESGLIFVSLSIAVADPSSKTISSATIQISGGYQNGGDTLSFANMPAIKETFVASKGILTLNGSDTLANYQAALRSIMFQSTSTNTSTRTVSFTVNDGTNNSNTVSRSIVFNNGPVPIVLNTVMSGTLVTGNSTQLYQLPANAGDVIYLQAISVNSTETSTSAGTTLWTLLDSNGNQVFSTRLSYNNNQSAYDAGRVVLASKGTYTLAVQGTVAANGITTFSFEAYAVNDTKSAFALGTPQTSTITTPGQQDVYTFSLTSPAALWFNSQTNDPSMNWELTGPQGTVYNPTVFSAGNQNVGLLPALLSGGAYTLTVWGTGSHTGKVAFNLLNDITNAKSIIAGISTSKTGATTTDTLPTPTSAVLYTFSANAGDVYTLHYLSATSGANTQWTLLDQWGAPVLRTTYMTNGDQTDLSLLSTGLYTLVIGGPAYATVASTYSFQVNFQSHTNISPTGTALTLETPYTSTSNPIGSTGEVDYQFTLPTATRLWFDSQANTSNAWWQLTGPQGVVWTPTAGSNATYFSSDDQSLGLLPAGPYQLKVYGSAGAAYGFRMLNLSSATALTLGTAGGGTAVPADGAQVYQFTTTSANEAVYLNVASFTSTDKANSGNTNWTILDPYGVPVFAPDSSKFFGGNNNPTDAGRYVLKNAGTYTVIVQGQVADSGTSTYKFNVIPTGDTTNTLALGSLVSSSLKQPGQRNKYTFILQSSASLYFNSLTDDSNMNWQLSGPTGVVQSLNFAYQTISLSADPRALGLLPGGSYTLTISGNGAHTGPYSFSMLDIGTGTTITPGKAVTNTLDPILTAQIYHLNATADEPFYFKSMSFTSTDTTSTAGVATWLLLDPFGHQVFYTTLGSNGHPNDAGRFVLANPGTYTLIIVGEINTGGGSSTYTFNVIATNDQTTPLTLGSAESGNIAVPGQYQNYTFSLPNPTVLWFDDGFSNSTNMYWGIKGLQGIVYPTGSSYGTNGFGHANDIGLVQAGTYTLTISGTGATTGAYTFRLLNLYAATPITAGNLTNKTGSTVPAVLSSATGANLFSFSANAGDVFSIHDLTSSGNPDGDAWALLDQWGRNLGGLDLGNDIANVKLLATAAYYIVAYSTVTATKAVDYSFQANFISHTNPAVSGTVVALGTQYGSTANPIGSSGVVNYQFTLPGQTWLWFDSLANDSSAAWQLSGPQGTVKNSTGFNLSDADLGLLQKGIYSLTVTGSTGAAYGFRILNVGSATPITPGNAKSDTLTPANSTQLYQFSANAGQAMYFSVQSFTSTDSNAGGITDWQLYDSYGNRIFSTEFGSNGNPIDAGRYILSLGGTYTLAIIGRVGDINSSNYKFNVIPITDTNHTLTLDTAVSDSITTQGQQNNYIFNLTTPTMIWFDTRTDDSNLIWTLTGPQGIIRWNRFSDDDQSFGLLLTPGKYTLTIGGNTYNGYGGHTGDYEFDLFG